jgi:outer membrane protein assembly factor BamA
VGYVRRETNETFITDRVGFTVEQETRFGDHYVLNYGYRIERTHTYDRTPDPLIPFDITRRVAPLTATLSRDTRDDVLDATHGSLASQAFEWGPAILGSELRFVRYFGQYYRYFPISKPVAIPWTKGMRKARLVYATGVRVGLATGLGGQELIPSERFFAGGGTTIRGFKQDMAGPKIGNSPVGGNALFILNNEIRFPLYSIFDGVGFVDIGNVYKSASDFSFSDIRKTAGIGLRARTPYFLLRLDWGFKLDRKTGEPGSAIFFSIGQAF